MKNKNNKKIIKKKSPKRLHITGFGCLNRYDTVFDDLIKLFPNNKKFLMPANPHKIGFPLG
jgi:hypothetical protein